MQLGDKLLEIIAYDFEKWDGISNFVNAPGVFEFTWDEADISISGDDTWSLRTAFDFPGVGGNNTDATGFLEYTMAIVDSSATFATARLDTATNTSPVTVTKAIAGFSPDPLIIAVDNLGSVPGIVPIGGTFIRVTDNYKVGTGGLLNSFNNTFTQKDVPGPLPLMGAGMAFGFSRKLRNRIKTSARVKA